MATTTAANGARKFEGPFLVLGVLPSWPEELERRSDYKGPHTQLSALFPIQALPAEPKHVERLVKLSPLPKVSEDRSEVVRKLGPWKERVERQSRGINDDKLAHLMTALGRPRTAKQIARKLRISRPTVDTWMRALQRAIGPALRIRVQRQGSRGPLAKFYWIDVRHAP